MGCTHVLSPPNKRKTLWKFRPCLTASKGDLWTCHRLKTEEKCNNINFTWLSFFDNLQIITKARLPFERYSAYLAVVYLVIAYVCTQSCPSLWDLMDYSLPGFSVHGILQASILERAAISYSNESSWPRDPTLRSYVSLLPLALAGRFFTMVPPDH